VDLPESGRQARAARHKRTASVGAHGSRHKTNRTCDRLLVELVHPGSALLG
jgi:hypothetical protein